MASGPQKPRWFVSHWWGEPVHDFVACLEQHAADHCLEDDTAYWVCAYANNQHTISSDVTADPSESSFYKAIELADRRVVSVVDLEGVTYRRIWCILEIFMGMKGIYEMYCATPHGVPAYDLSSYSMIADAVGKEGFRGEAWQAEVYRRLPRKEGNLAIGFTSGPAEVDRDHAFAQNFRQSHFPMHLIQSALKLKVEDAQATIEDDRRHILNYIAGRRGVDLEQDPQVGHRSFTETTEQLHGMFAGATFRLWIEQGNDVGVLIEAIKHSRVTKLALSLRGCTSFTDDMAKQLAAALPSTLREVRLETVDSGATEEGGRTVLDSVFGNIQLSSLQVLEMSDCLLSGRLPEAIGECAAMTELTLAGNQLSGPFPVAIGKCAALRELRIQNNRFSGPVPSAIGECRQLTLLRMNGNLFTGTIPASFGRLTKLRELRAQNNLHLLGPLPAELDDAIELAQLAVDERLLKGMPQALKDRVERGELQINQARRGN